MLPASSFGCHWGRLKGTLEESTGLKMKERTNIRQQWGKLLPCNLYWMFRQSASARESWTARQLESPHPEWETDFFQNVAEQKGWVKNEYIIGKSIHMLFVTFQSQAPDPGLGGLKIWGGVSQFCAVNISYPSMGASFERRNDQNWTLMHRDFLSINIF